VLEDSPHLSANPATCALTFLRVLSPLLILRDKFCGGVKILYTLLNYELRIILMPDN
jgi:hypothetical protein